jgi:hypothetical protein
VRRLGKNRCRGYNIWYILHRRWFAVLLLASDLRLEKIKLNLANDSFTPRSARINFATGASPQAQEAYPTKFKSLTEKVEMFVGGVSFKLFAKTSSRPPSTWKWRLSMTT